jgi:hypothetical protein
MQHLHKWKPSRIKSEKRMQRFFLSLISIHLSECKSHIVKSETTGICVTCQVFTCKVCGVSQPFNRHFLDLPDQATTQQMDDWMCEVISQAIFLLVSTPTRR